MAGNKRGRGGKASRYRSAATGAPATRHQNNPEAIASRFLPHEAPLSGFTLADEVRNTANNRAASGIDGKLRTRPVVFVNAGIVEPLKELEEDLCANDKAGDCKPNGPDENPSAGRAIAENASAQMSDNVVLSQQSHTTFQPEEENSPFFIDITGDKTLSQQQGEPVHIPSPRSSNSDSDSGEDVVLFKGRKGIRLDEPRPAIADEITIQVHKVEVTMQQISLDTAIQPSRRELSSPSPKHWQLRGHNDEDAIVADYIANMINDDEDSDGDDREDDKVNYHSFVRRDLGGSDGEFGEAEESGCDDSLLHDEQSEIDDPDVLEAEESGTSDIDDETLARLLAKQDELGLGDDELVLFSAEGYSGTRSSRARGLAAGRTNIANGSSKGKKTARNQIPSAGAVADAFDDLDLMDWDRHNPPRKPKSKRGQPDFNVSDSEIEATLQASWQKDRLRKKEKKREREELRAGGLLGKKSDPNDPRVKYPTHINIDQIKEEMRDFLCGTEPNFFFPPMDPHARKIVHELANKFNIKSKSAGRGDQRRTALHRTLRTVRYQERYFEEVFNRSGRKYFGRPDVKSRAPNRTGESGGRSGRGGVNHSAFTYRDGEVVGASAPELGETNKGRAMLEKMGWSRGMALGADDNKGIMQPVVHVVKRTKAGLG